MVLSKAASLSISTTACKYVCEDNDRLPMKGVVAGANAWTTARDTSKRKDLLANMVGFWICSSCMQKL